MLRVRNTTTDGSSRQQAVQAPLHASTNSSSTVPAAVARQLDRFHEKEKPLQGRGRIGLRVPACIMIAAAITLVVYWVTPDDHVLKLEAEQVAQAALAAEHELEREMMEWWSQNGLQQPPIPQQELSDMSGDGKLETKNRWVEGEKKLKEKLKILAERQRQGKDIGVPVLTRWLGDDIPAWAGEGVDVEEWKRKVDQKYAEMREEENEWQKHITALLEREAHLG